MLSDLRVLDLSGEIGLMCGQLLADMGADVQQWVRPRDEERLRADAHWRTYTVGKGVHVLEWPEALQRLRELLPKTDLLIESESESFWSEHGLSEQAFAAEFPELIRINLSPFGRLGPKSHYQATDLISVAASGHLYLSGEALAAPLRISIPQAHAHACADGAVAAVIALCERARSGRGQTVDLSAQESTTFPLLSRALDAAVGQPKALRAAFGSQIGEVFLKNQFEARDGSVLVLQGILPPLAAFMSRLMAWVHEAGFIEKEQLQIDWGQAASGLMMGTLGLKEWSPVQDGIARLIARHTKAEIMAEAVSRRLLVAPILTLDDVLDSHQLSSREFLTHSQRLGQKRLGPFARMSETPLPLTENDAHTWEGASEFEPFLVATEDEGTLPLAGLKVLDLFWVVAGPGATRMLADYGATVIHVETSQRLDMVRNVPPYVDGVADPERAACHHNTNTNKLNIAIDLSSAEGKGVLQDLIRWADVFTESFAPGVIDRMGFSYDSARLLNPEIIMISSSLMGQTGPWSAYAGYGNSAAAVTGFHALTGEKGAQPTGCFGPYTDFTSVRFNALAILAAVRHQRRTGRGQYIDMSQAEAALQFLAPACLDYLGSGMVAGARGNDDPRYVPHGVFPALGDDRWVAISVRSDLEWQNFCDIAELSQHAALDQLGRRSAEAELTAEICEWTSVREAGAIEALLQEHGIPAHRVSDTLDLYDDPQLQAREHFIKVTHRDYPASTVESSRLRFSRTEPRRPETAPWFGIDTEQVLRGVLGYSSDIIQALEEAEVLR